MIRNLSPGYMRIGGTMADRIKFSRGNLQQFKQNSVTCIFERDRCLLPNQNYVLSGRIF